MPKRIPINAKISLFINPIIPEITARIEKSGADITKNICSISYLIKLVEKFINKNKTAKVPNIKAIIYHLLFIFINLIIL